MTPIPRDRLPMLHPKRLSLRPLALSVLLVAGLTTPSGCGLLSSSTVDDPADDMQVTDETAEASDQDAAGAPLRDSTTYAAQVADARAGGQTADETLDQLVEATRVHAKLVDQRLSLLVDGFIDEGLALMKAGDIAGAHEQFGHAYELDPLNPLARNLHSETAASLGDTGGGLSAMATDARHAAMARDGQKQLLVSHNLEQGRLAQAAGNPEVALEHFETALALLRFNPSISQDNVTEADVAALVAGARHDIGAALSARDAALADEARRRQQEFDFAEKNRLSLRIDGLLRQANRDFLADKYKAAIKTLDELLVLAPHNDEGANLRRIATRADYTRESRVIREEYRDRWVDTFDDMEWDTVIPNDKVEFPTASEWARTEARGPRTFASEAQTRSATDLAIMARLQDVRIPVDFQNAELPEVLDHLARVTGVNFLMSPDVEDVVLDNIYDHIDRSPHSVDRVLKILLEDLSLPPLTYTVRDGVVRIITQDESRGDYILEMYDIRDLSFTPVDHPSRDFNLIPSGTDAESFNEGVDEDDPLPLVSEDTLLSLIQDNISPDTWSDDPQRSISQMPGTLVVKTTEDVHEQIRQLLKDLRRNTNTLVHIETRFIEVEDSFLEDIGVDLRGLTPAQGGALEDFGQANAGGVGTPSNPSGIGTGIDSGAFYAGTKGDLKSRTENLFDSVLGESDVLTGGGGISLEALFLDDTNVNAVLRAVTKYQNSNIVNAPSLTLRSGQRGNISVLTNRTYVRDFEPEIAQAAVIAQPELGIVSEGIVLDVRAVASADRRFVTLELRPTLAELIPGPNGEPLPEELVSLGTPNANNVTIQLPELKIQRLRTTATIPDGATLLLGGLKTSIEQDFRSETPFFADIPIISFFFQRQGQYVSKRKLLILLTAKIISPEELEPNTSYLR